MAPFSIFPLELWFMIFQYLRDDESPQHISRLAQTCRSFHQELNHVIYQPVRLRRVENAQRFATTISSRPDLAALVKEVRHTQDAGFADYAGYSESFYKALTKLQNLETLVMRETILPLYEYSPQWAVQELLADISYDAQVSYVRDSCLDDIIMDMEGLGYPLGKASDPLGLGFHPRTISSIQCWAEDLIENTYFSRDNLKDLIPALRTCHIGTDSDLNPIPQRNQVPCIDFNVTIFTLPHLQKLCITGVMFREFELEETSIDNCAASLKELLLLNCRLSAEHLGLIIRFPRALERLTIRVPLALKSLYQEDEYLFFSGQLSALHSKSLEYVDLDIYGGAQYGLTLDPFDVLKEVIVTPHSMFANGDEEMILPDSLQRLTLRYEEGSALHLGPLLKDLEDGNLYNLRSVICQIPDNICERTANLEAGIEAAAFKPKFKDLGVELSTELVPYPLTVPKYDVCPCENLTFFHQFPFNPCARPRPRAANRAAAN